MRYYILLSLITFNTFTGCSSSNPARSLASQSLQDQNENVESETFFSIRLQKTAKKPTIIASWKNVQFDLVEKYHIEISSDDQNYILHGEVLSDKRTSTFTHHIEVPELGLYFVRLKTISKYGFSEIISTQRIDIR